MKAWAGLAPKNGGSAIITFDTGVAQDCITFPQLFNALLRMFTVTGQKKNNSNRLQIGMDQQRDNQGDVNGY